MAKFFVRMVKVFVHTIKVFVRRTNFLFARSSFLFARLSFLLHGQVFFSRQVVIFFDILISISYTNQEFFEVNSFLIVHRIN